MLKRLFPMVLVVFLLGVAPGWAQEKILPPAEPAGPPPAAPALPPTLPPPDSVAPAPTAPGPEEVVAPAPFPALGSWPEVWGIAGLDGYVLGNRMAPNGVPYDPLFSADLDLNLGLLPRKKLYLFALGQFWAQKATAGVTNPTQGAFDFSKRELDLLLGAAWNYWGPLELRVFGYSYNNLNRGYSLTVPYGYLDGLGLENRYYLPGTDIYDIARLRFLSFGYYPTKNLIGMTGDDFKPSVFARAYLTYDLVPLKYYVYGDAQIITERPINPKLLYLDAGLAARPFNKLAGLEFRLGSQNIEDVRDHYGRTLLYFSVRLLF